MVGFVNALAILIFTAQVPHLIGMPWLVYMMVAAALAVMVFLPRITTAVPAPLVAIVVLTAMWRPPLLSALLPDGVPITVTSSRTCRKL